MTRENTSTAPDRQAGTQFTSATAGAAVNQLKSSSHTHTHTLQPESLLVAIYLYSVIAEI